MESKKGNKGEKNKGANTGQEPRTMQQLSKLIGSKFCDKKFDYDDLEPADRLTVVGETDQLQRSMMIRHWGTDYEGMAERAQARAADKMRWRNSMDVQAEVHKAFPFQLQRSRECDVGVSGCVQGILQKEFGSYFETDHNSIAAAKMEAKWAGEKYHETW
mmetsp:Transcript_2803/g.4570  ORF Transcript_2803/g.4570 Transcript_2803/m.4570 type:complete len:160 (-) Transcript_2803:294-773(-)